MNHRARPPALVLIVAAAALAGSCATNETTRYVPTLNSVTIPLGDSEAPLTALVSVVGPTAGDREMPARIEVRLRLDSHAEHPATLVPGGLEVVTADLQSLGRPELIPAGPVVIAPGGETTLRAAFALPPALKPNADALRALNVRLSLEVEGRRYASSVTFDRMERVRSPVYRPYEYGYWPYPGFAGAPVIVGRHHHRM